MKRIITALAMVTTINVVQATDIGIHAGRSGSAGYNDVGVTIGKKFDKFGVELSADRTVVKGASLNKFSTVGTYDVASLGTANLAVKAGAAYLSPSFGAGGYATLVGAGVSVPVTQNVSFVADYQYQIGQTRVNYLNGNNFLVGLKYSF